MATYLSMCKVIVKWKYKIDIRCYPFSLLELIFRDIICIRNPIIKYFSLQVNKCSYHIREASNRRGKIISYDVHELHGCDLKVRCVVLKRNRVLFERCQFPLLPWRL